MKKMAVVVAVIWALYVPSAYAAWTEWPGIKQAVGVGMCVLADSGKLVEIVARHVSGAAVETLTVVKDCIVFVVDQVTPGKLTSPAPTTEPTHS